MTNSKVGTNTELLSKISMLSKGEAVSFSAEEAETIISFFLMDKNSSTLREMVTLAECGYSQNPEKLGYDGWSEDGRKFEVKPKNISAGSNKKLDGGGNFSDFTWERYDKYLSDNVYMLCSGFVDGKLAYIIEFPFSSLKKRIEACLEKQFPNRERKAGTYARSITFSFSHYKNGEVDVKYCDFNLVNEQTVCSEILNFFKLTNLQSNQASCMIST
jgi:hypothetical protein